MKNDFRYLAEMGLDHWILSSPEKLMNYDTQKVKPDARAKLLFVCPEKPEDSEDILLLEKIVNSFQLTLQHIQHVSPERLNIVDYDHIEWIWFSGCRTQKLSKGTYKILESSLLSEMRQNPQAKRHLWQQIQANLNKSCA